MRKKHFLQTALEKTGISSYDDYKKMKYGKTLIIAFFKEDKKR